jgi:hypothetical protein
MELARQLSWSQQRAELYHSPRTSAGFSTWRLGSVTT